ncbi:MAG: hypothetical protein PUH12_01955 [Lachnospiraceae bacterium]|nr:hypothetical protein [Lachnospiraceae bacterium]
MIVISEQKRAAVQVVLIGRNEAKDLPYVSADYQAVSVVREADRQMTVYIGQGDDPLTVRSIQELSAGAAETVKQMGICEYGMDLRALVQAIGVRAVSAVIEGIYTGSYEICLPGEKEKKIPDVSLTGINPDAKEKARQELERGLTLAEAKVWARNMVNAPGNLLRPMDFAREIMELVKDTTVNCELFDDSTLNAMGMEALTSVGRSSENPPCMLILRYRGAGDAPVNGLIGKGVTCDTGGYCLKPAGSMMGIKGDMAGGAAVAAAIYTLAAGRVKVNVTGVIPMCENRIGPSALVPGDVISSYGGKKIEICNTDAEGRLILADAMAYMVNDEQADRVIDIATLTGAVVGMLGFSTAGLLSDDDAFCRAFLQAAECGGERYWRLPIFEEQKKMLQSKIADIKNMGQDYCGTITAGLFIREFARNRPWIHLDIAGTAWVDKPLYQGQPQGATAAGASTLYYLLSEEKAICF